MRIAGAMKSACTKMKRACAKKKACSEVRAPHSRVAGGSAPVAYFSWMRLRYSITAKMRACTIGSGDPGGA
jgi:hypothetical protein